MKTKVIRVKSNSVCAIFPQAEVSWEDVWISYFDGRHRIFYGPMIASKSDLIGVIEQQKDMAVRFSDPEYRRELRESMERDFGEPLSEDYLSDFDNSDDIAEFEAVLDKVNRKNYALHLHNGGDKVPDIFTHFETLNRKNMEEALIWFLHTHCKLTAPLKFSWVKPRFFIHPTGH